MEPEQEMLEAAGRVRLAKWIARRGVASRREAETAIAAGRVTVNGEVAVIGAQIDPTTDVVRYDGRPLPEEPQKVYYLLYKPKGFITGRDDPEGRRSVLELLEGLNVRVEPVGRLDFDTEGALLLTNDGDLAHALTHPSRKVPKRYTAKVYRTPDEADLAAIRKGVFLDDGRTAPAKARLLDKTDKENAWVEVTVTEGRYRLIRRVFAQLGHPVSKLRRESFATLSIRGMERGELRPLTGAEIDRLRALAEGREVDSAKPKRGKGFARPKITTPRRGRKRPDRA
jgi:23S rRNA pseudouridine2605 synthase